MESLIEKLSIFEFIHIIRVTPTQYKATLHREVADDSDPPIAEGTGTTINGALMELDADCLKVITVGRVFNKLWAKYKFDLSERQHVIDVLRSCYQDGFNEQEMFRLASLTEHVQPSLSEDLALARMNMVMDEVIADGRYKGKTRKPRKGKA